MVFGLGFIMHRFKENTPQEQGFAALWDKHIAPGLDGYTKSYTKNIILLSVVWVGLIALFLWIVGKYQHDTSDVIMGLDGQNIIVIAAIVGAGLGYLVYLPFSRLTSGKKTSFKTAIDEHFANRLLPYEDDNAIEAVVSDLHDRKILPKNNPRIRAAYQSRDGLFRFFNITFTQTRTSGNNTSREVIPYLVLEMQLNQSLSSEIRILTDDALDNFFRRIFQSKKTVRLANNEFEKLFEVFSNDAELVNTIFTPDVQQNFVDMQNYFFTPYSRWSGSRRITAGLKDDTFTIAIHGLDDVAGEKLAIRSPKKLVQSAKTAIQRMNEVIEIVETLREVIPVIKRP